jgi:hypothetical protein
MFLAQKPIAYMVSQPTNSLDIAQIMDTGKIFLAKLPEGLLGRENSYLLGTLLISKFHQLVMARQAKNIAVRRDYWIYADEFANFITPSMAEILSGARKYRIGLTLAHHELHQLQRSPEVASAVMTHPFTRIVFRVGDDDARKLAEGFSFFEANDLKNLETGHAIARVQRSNFDFNLHVVNPDQVSETDAIDRKQEVLTASRKKYGTPKADVEAMLRQAWDVEQAKIKPLPKSSPPAAAPIESAKVAPSEAPDFASLPAPKIEKAEAAPNQIPQPVAQTPPPEAPVAEVHSVAADNKDETGNKDKGIGGHQHNLIRERIETVAKRLGYTTSRENPTGGGQKIDVVLQNSHRAIACEIAITTTIDHEVGNVAKCLKAGFANIAVISPTIDRLRKIENAVRASLPASELARVAFYEPEAFVNHLESIASADKESAEHPLATETKIGKYKVKHSVAALTPEEIKEREKIAYRMLAETMKRKK